MPEKVVCIVGVAGFIGSHLLEKVIRERTWTVIGIDMVSPTKIQQLLGAEKKWAARFEFHQMNIVHMSDDLKALIARSDVVVNLAAICNPSEYIKQPVNTINSNFTDAQDCIKYCVELDKHLIHFSTCEVYGRTLASYGLPQDDPKNYILDEDTTPMIMGPVSAQRWCYACAKQLVERLIYAHGTENNLKFTIVRPYNWIGPRMDYIPGVDGKDDGQPRVLASFMTALMKGEPLVLVNGGEVYRTFCFVDDAVDAVCRIIDHPDKSQGQTFNVGNPNNNIQVRLRFTTARGCCCALRLAGLQCCHLHATTRLADASSARRCMYTDPQARRADDRAVLQPNRQAEGNNTHCRRRGVLRQGL